MDYFNCQRGKLADHFIDDTLVGVEIEGETGVAVCQI